MGQCPYGSQTYGCSIGAWIQARGGYRGRCAKFLAQRSHGFAEESGLPNEMGLIKNQYTQRTFIQPTQELREQGVRMKLSAVSGVVKGKRGWWIDDSIVRGTTSRRIVQLLKEAGVRLRFTLLLVVQR